MVSMTGGYRFLPHTADIKVEAWGSDLEEAFKYAGIAFSDIIVDVSKVKKKLSREFDADGGDIQELLYNFIERLILFVDLENIIFSDFNIDMKKASTYILNCTAYGDYINPDIHGYKTLVKAITYHEMEIIEMPEKILIRYVVDI